MTGNPLQARLLRFRRLPKPLRVVYAWPRTFIAIAFGCVAFLVLPHSLRPVTRALIGAGTSLSRCTWFWSTS